MRALSDWLALSRNGAIPSINHLHPREFSVPWRDTFLLWLAEDRQSAEFEYCGALFSEHGAVVPAGLPFDAQEPRHFLYHATAAFTLTVEEAAPVITEGIDSWHTGQLVKFRSILLPFSDSAHDFRYVLGAFSHRLDRASADVPVPDIRHKIFDRSSGELVTLSARSQAPE